MMRLRLQSLSRDVTTRALRLVVTLTVCAGGLASAHKIRCFAAADGDVIAGYAWFASGSRPRNVPFRVYDPTGKCLVKGETGNRGEFSFTPTRSCDHRVEVEAGPGHVAQFLIKASELPAGVAQAAAGTPPSPRQGQTEMTDRVEDPVRTKKVGAKATGHGDLEILISRAVSREIAPLRRELAEFKDKQRWQDIIAGVGYLAGVAGIAGFFLSRRASASC